jgi:nuclease-like protein
VTTKHLALRRADTCCVCQLSLAAGTEAVWDSEDRTVTCLACFDGPSESVAGHSARAEGVQRRQKELDFRDSRREARPILGRIANFLEGPVTAGDSYLIGAAGEEELGAGLDYLKAQDVFALHDRRIPKSPANIDHIAIAPSGVWSIDAKRYTGMVRVVNKGGWLRPDWRLTVNGRDRTSRTDQVLGQIKHIRSALDAAGEADVPVFGALCFIDSGFPFFSKPQNLNGVRITWGRALQKELVEDGPIDVAHRHRLVALLDQAFPPK